MEQVTDTENHSHLTTGLRVQDLQALWDQAHLHDGTGVVYVPYPRSPNGQLWVRLPHRFLINVDAWIRVGRRRVRSLDQWSWRVPRRALDVTVRRVVQTFGRVYLIRHCRRTEVCARRCWEARGFDCVCSCQGTKHGSHDDARWYEVSDTFAVRSSFEYLTGSLITAR